MDPRASLSVLLMIFGISQAAPLVEKRLERALASDPKPEDYTSRILETNKGSSKFLMEGDLVLPKTRNALSCFNNKCFWKKNSSNIVEVPYTLSSEYSDSEKSKIVSAMSTFHAKTCIRFVPRSSQKDYISIESIDGCYSSYGRTGGKQVVSLYKIGCLGNGVVQHELNHALGFYHEHARSDRDQYVKINWENIAPNDVHNFKKQNSNNQNTTYDYGSVMHYGKGAFSIQDGINTITPIPDETVKIGKSKGMSDIDILRINKLYEC